MRISVTRREEQRVGSWAGGTTTQLAIGPEGADYAARRFEWRISTARVDLDESDFTPLPGFQRILMILEGAVHLTHEGIREVDLGPFEQDSFEGAWKTRSRGRCVDFNLMTARGWSGAVAALSPIPGAPVSVPLAGAIEAFYCLQDAVIVTIGSAGGGHTEPLDRGDFLLVESPAPEAVLTVTTWEERTAGVHATLTRT